MTQEGLPELSQSKGPEAELCFPHWLRRLLWLSQKNNDGEREDDRAALTRSLLGHWEDFRWSRATPRADPSRFLAPWVTSQLFSHCAE